MKAYKYITILLIVLLGIFCGRNWGESLAPDTYLYPMICFGLALIVWGSDYAEKSQDENPLCKAAALRRGCLFEMIDDMPFEMTDTLSF